MKTASILVVAAFLCFSLPVGDSANAFLPGLPSWGGCDGAAGYKPDSSVKAKVGYLGYNRGLVFGMGATATVLDAINTLQEEYPLQGLWLAASVEAGGPGGGFTALGFGDGLRLKFEASWLIPNNKADSETGTFAGGNFSRAWNTSTQFYTLDGSASWSMGSNFAVIGGFRYDYLSTAFSNGTNFSLIAASPADEAELTFNSYIPYLGAVVTAYGGARAGVRGFPYVPGNFTLGDTFGTGFGRFKAQGSYNSSYFLETFLEFGRELWGGQLSAFATYTWLHANGYADFSVATLQTRTYYFSLDRQTWTVGGMATLSFATPF